MKTALHGLKILYIVSIFFSITGLASQHYDSIILLSHFHYDIVMMMKRNDILTTFKKVI